jgi:predicted aminopeptidase
LRDEFRSLVRSTRARLIEVYASNAADADKRAGKAAAFKAMRTKYELLKASLEGAQGFDRWFASGANNAGIAASGLYDDRVQQFAALLAAEGGDLPRFYNRVKDLAALPKAERERALTAVSRVAAARTEGSSHPLVLDREIK